MSNFDDDPEVGKQNPFITQATDLLLPNDPSIEDLTSDTKLLSLNLTIISTVNTMCGMSILSLPFS
jgi:hypothetical protein